LPQTIIHAHSNFSLIFARPFQFIYWKKALKSINFNKNPLKNRQIVPSECIRRNRVEKKAKRTHRELAAGVVYGAAAVRLQDVLAVDLALALVQFFQLKA
jgi:hypothetical protein